MHSARDDLSSTTCFRARMGWLGKPVREAGNGEVPGMRQPWCSASPFFYEVGPSGQGVEQFYFSGLWEVLLAEEHGQTLLLLWMWESSPH